jgi:hypothetical protein
MPTTLANAGSQFDAADKALAAVGTQLDAQASISPDQWQAALNGYAALAAFAAQVGPQVPYVASQWEKEKPIYDAWFQSRLAKVTGGTAATPVATTTIDPVTGQVVAAPAAVDSSSNWILIAGLGLVVWLLIKSKG